jgi:4-hydroxy-tetrahydrodipicolinate synthase
VEAGVGVYLGSGGAGEGHALSLAELRAVYDVGVEVCKGRVPVYANPPEPRTGAAMLVACQQAVQAGVDVVQIYPLDGGHAMRPTFAEQERYYRDLLDAIDHPVALSVHVYSGYIAPIPLLKRLCADYPQIVAINVMGTPLAYLVELRDAVGPRLAIYTRMGNMIEGLVIGCQGSLAAEPNIIPRHCKRILDLYLARDMEGCGKAMTDLVRFATIVNRWSPSTARWVKMAMKVLDLPGGRGGLRKPYLMPPENELAEMAAAFEQLGVRRLEGLA